jgi:hypothetical protein
MNSVLSLRVFPKANDVPLATDCYRSHLTTAMGNFSADDKDGEIFSVRAHNAYVVSAGSIHPDTGQPYEIITEPMGGGNPHGS